MNSSRLTANKVDSLNGHIEVPGDKSISHRAILLAMLSKAIKAIWSSLVIVIPRDAP